MSIEPDVNNACGSDGDEAYEDENFGRMASSPNSVSNFHDS
jgi:hypothetical protein